MTVEGLPSHSDNGASDLHLTSSQLEFLSEVDRKVDLSTLNRKFSIIGTPPHRRLERKGLIIETEVTDADLLALARVGFLDYRSQERAVLFHEKPNDRLISGGIAPKRSIKIAGSRVRLKFGRHPSLTIIRLLLLAGSIALGLAYAIAGASGATIQTWAAIGGLLVAALALGLPQRDRK